MLTRKIEILSPAGSFESLKAAVSAGADAVYVGGTRFGARAYADNFTEEELLEAIDYVHLHNRKLYLTINTLLKDEEIKELYSYILPYYLQGIDAVIVQDIGVLQYIKEQFPDLPIHASTQMTITSVPGAEFLESLGVERVVTARELQLEEVKDIAQHTNLEIESFVHGALCYSYSGQCLFSSLLGGRSGNRGQCAQPCRLPYAMQGEKKSQYLLSLKDISTLEYIPELIDAGITSFKIEGRMKKPEYVALVTAMYRKYIDLYLEKGKASFNIEPKDKEKLLDIYNRGGACGGYYYTKNGRNMMSFQKPNHTGVEALKVLKQSGKQLTVKTLVDLRKGDVIAFPAGDENYTFSDSIAKGSTLVIRTHKIQHLQAMQCLCRTRNESLITEIREEIINQKCKEKISGQLILAREQPATFSVACRGFFVEVTGEKAQAPINQPVEMERIERQLRKTGNTPFEFQDLNILLKEALFIPMQSLNELRRMALDELEKEIVRSYRRRLPCK